jgi:hypothetical protein
MAQLDGSAGWGEYVSIDTYNLQVEALGLQYLG